MIGDLAPEGYRTSFGHSVRRIAKLARLVKPYKGRTILALLALLGTTAAALAGPWVAKLAIDDGITPHDRMALVMYVVLYLVLAIIGLVLESAQTYLTTWVGQRVLTDLRVELFGHIQKLELGYFEEQRTGRLISRLTNDVDALEQLVTDGVTSSVQNTITLAGTAALMLLLDWRLALATLVVFPLMAISTALFRVYSSRAYRRMRERLAEVTAALQEDLSGARVVQAFRREDQNLKKFAETNEVYRESNRVTVLLNALYFPFVEFLSSIATAIVLAYGGYLFFQGDMELGTLFAFIAYLSNFFDPVQALSQLYNTFLAANAALDKIFDVMDTKPRLTEKPGAVELGPLAGRVDLDDLHFGYGSGPEVLHGVDLHVEAGQTVALVGHTGAGKSTLVKLLARFYDPRQGAIRIDGHDLRDVTLDSLRGQLGIVPQEGFLFAGTIRDNIAFGRPDAPIEDVRAAAEAVGADRFIEQLPDGYDTAIAERGAVLSIGQRQLVAFARALLANPRLLILDEATSSVDIATEGVIEQALERLLHGRTAFVVAHRLSTIRRADLIVVLENGRVLEKGTHEQLLAARGRYHSLYDDWVEAVA
jgi:ATP-binding cassette subfamily B protein